MQLLAQDVKNVFGTISPPDQIKPFVTSDSTGAAGISLFFNHLITLIYMVAAVVFVFMLVWGAMEWLLSGGDKDAVKAARTRITNAIIGIILFAVAFALIKVVGIFTGFTFFN